jgi:hypothetical protein
MIVMNLINRRQFEKKVTKFLQKEKAEALNEFSAPVGSSHIGDINLRKHLSI